MALAAARAAEALRDHFEVDYRFIALGALSALAREGQIENDVVVQAMKDLEIDPAKPIPFICELIPHYARKICPTRLRRKH